MKKKFAESKIDIALRRARSGTPTANIIRKMEISKIIFYRWKRKYVEMGISELRRL
jgi:putative transposase